MSGYHHVYVVPAFNGNEVSDVYMSARIHCVYLCACEFGILGS
jgi:hypothetical protein